MCPESTIQAFADCVAACQQTVIEGATGETLTEACDECYGDSVTCGTVDCSTEGCSVPDSPSCIMCRCEKDCIPGFDRCSGLPGESECSREAG